MPNAWPSRATPRWRWTRRTKAAAAVPPPRSNDKPQYRIEDLHGAADFFTRYPGVDGVRLGLLGLCGGTGDSLSAAKSDRRFKALATLRLFNAGRVRRKGFAASQLGAVPQRLKQASEARAQEAAGNQADSRYMTGEAFAKAVGAKDKALFLIDGATHIETHWVPRQVDAALAKLTSFDAKTW